MVQRSLTNSFVNCCPRHSVQGGTFKGRYRTNGKLILYCIDLPLSW